MGDFGLSTLLGVIEGLTEFLPVSSTAHLRIAEALLGVNLGSGYWKMFTIVIQLGAILTLPIYFRKRIASFLASFPWPGRRSGPAAGGPSPAATANPAAAPASAARGWLAHPLTLTMIAFVVTAIPALLLIKVIGKHLESLTVMGWALVVGGVVMWVVDALYARGRLRTRTPDMAGMGLGQALWIGACQITSAVFPGVSRSMSTIAAGQLAGMTRESALEFSFFLSMPSMVAATGYDLVKTVLHGASSPLGAVQMTAHGWVLLAIGFVVSFVVAYGVVAWFMGWVRRGGFVPFAVWRLVVGAGVLIWMTPLGR